MGMGPAGEDPEDDALGAFAGPAPGATAELLRLCLDDHVIARLDGAAPVGAAHRVGGGGCRTPGGSRVRLCRSDPRVNSQTASSPVTLTPASR